MSKPRHHILSVLVQNKAGVLARVAGLFARRGYNIFSLAVAPTEDPELSRITIVVDVEETPLDPSRSVERELLIATVRAGAEVRGQLVELANIFDAKVVAVGVDALTLSLEGSPDKLDDFEELLRGYGIVELQRTGRIALPKLDREARVRAVKGKAS
jgi:acetolactate synthase-1/3 small subunit